MKLQSHVSHVEGLPGVATYIVALYIWEGEFLGQMLSDRGLPTTSRPCDDPNMLYVVVVFGGHFAYRDFESGLGSTDVILEGLQSRGSFCRQHDGDVSGGMRVDQ